MAVTLDQPQRLLNAAVTHANRQWYFSLFDTSDLQETDARNSAVAQRFGNRAQASQMQPKAPNQCELGKDAAICLVTERDNAGHRTPFEVLVI